MIDLDITLFIQLLNFLITLVVLNYVLIKPVRKILIERKNTITDITKHIKMLIRKKQDLDLLYEEIIEKTKKEGKQNYKEAELEANKTKEQLLNTASHNARTILKDKQASLENEAAIAQQGIHATITDFSKIAVTKLLT